MGANNRATGRYADSAGHDATIERERDLTESLCERVKLG
jgi:hypothetical protein